MPCIPIAGGYLCTTGVREIIRKVQRCPVCERRRRFVWVYGWSLYYAPIGTCLGCGDSFAEGERMERPFQRGWRAKAKKKAREEWANAFRMTDAEREAWFREQFEPVEGVAS